MSGDTVIVLNSFLSGATAMGSAAVSLFFLRFWRQTHDRFLALFSSAFAILAVNWTCLALAQPADETRHWFYLVRLSAFLLILGAIIAKNRTDS